MSVCHGSLLQEVRPGTARVLVTELSGSGCINPTPVTKPCEETETAEEIYVSPEKLESLCGTQDLSHVTSLEFCIDTQENTLGNFGAYMPKLVQLKMNNSRIMSVRDLGTTLSHLQVLWMSRCCLQDLDGISSFSSLKELYAAYNNVSDLSPVGMLAKLQLLDLEGNDVDDLVQVQYLGLCSKLQTLTLEGNPVCSRPHPTTTQMGDYSYRAAVRELVPQLCYLDDVKVEEDSLSCCSAAGEDWGILRDSIKDCNTSQAASNVEEPADSACLHSRHSSARRPSSGLPCFWPPSSSGSRPHTGSRPVSAPWTRILSPPGSRPGSSDSDLATVEAESSNLMHEAGKIRFCGNLVQAIRAKRKKSKTAPTRSSFTPRDLPIHVPEHTYDLEKPELTERANVFAELRAWRTQHSRHLQAIEKERLPQVLVIQHGDGEDSESDEEEGFSGMKSDCDDEEHGADKYCDSVDTASPDSSFASLSPDLQHSDVISPDIARLCLSPDKTLSPSPPLAATLSGANCNLLSFRARRLHLIKANSKNILDFESVGHGPEIGTAAADDGPQKMQQRMRTNVPLLPLSAQITHKPSQSALGEGLKESCVRLDTPSHKHQMSKICYRPAITRPHTARAVLQTHHQRHILQPNREKPQQD